MSLLRVLSDVEALEYPSLYYCSDWQQQELLQLVISNLDKKELYFLSALLMVRGEKEDEGREGG